MSDELDIILSRRQVPKVPEGLNARIIAAAARHQQGVGLSQSYNVNGVGDLLNVWLGSFSQPAYAYGAVVCLLVAGFMLGAGLEGSADYEALNAQNFASFMAVEEQYVAEEWI